MSAHLHFLSAQTYSSCPHHKTGPAQNQSQSFTSHLVTVTIRHCQLDTQFLPTMIDWNDPTNERRLLLALLNREHVGNWDEIATMLGSEFTAHGCR